MCLALFGGAPGLPEILLILFVVLLLFGAKKLPDLARSLGRSLSEFKRGRDEGARGKELEPSKDEKTDEEDKSQRPEER